MLTDKDALRLAADACDLALVVDRTGTIREVAEGNPELLAALGAGGRFAGKKWVDLVVPDGRPK
ncbi:MAG: hypothetical protein ACKOGH_13045, partial [Alphaproteobacteria bacterium]